MITPSPREDKGERNQVAALATTALVAILAGVLVAVQVPEVTTTRDLYRELDPDQIADMQPSPEVEPEETPEETSTDEEEAPEEAVEEETEPQKSPERVDLGDMAEQQDDVDLGAEETPGETSEQSDVDDKPTRIDAGEDVAQEEAGESGGFDTFNDPSDRSVPQGEERGGEGGEDDEGIALARGERETSADDGAGFGEGGEVVGGGEGRASAEESGAAIEVGLQDIEEFGEDHQDIEMEKLLEWLRQNPRELPPGVKQHVNYQSGNLASTVSFEAKGGSIYDLFIMVKEEIMEVHVVIVSGEDTRYLVDRSFTEEGRFFRVGSAQRDGENTITSIRSERRPLGEQSEEFYEVFLSWWEKAKQDVDV